VFPLLFRLALAGAAFSGRLLPLAGRTAARVVGRGAKKVSRAAGKGARATRGAAAPAAVGAGGALAVGALDDGTPVIIPPAGGSVGRRRRRGNSDLVQIAQLEIAKEVITNPVFSFLLSFIAIEVLQSQKIVGNTAGSIAEVALGGIAYAKAISPLVERIGPAATEMAGSDLVTGKGGALGIPGVPII